MLDFQKGINVLSLFDGISCGQVALEKTGIKVNKYYASEIDKYAIQVTQKNYPNTIQLGDVEVWWLWDIDWASIDLLIGGSPCQGFSFAGKQLNFDDPRSKLFFVYADILRHIRKYNPDVKFLLENVRMKKEYQDVISSYLGVEPVEINSALVSAQNRKRLYWTNIGIIEQPEDRGILLKDIVRENTDSELPVKYTERNMRHFRDKDEKGLCCTATMYKGAGNNGTTLIFESLKEYIVPFDKTLQILEKEVERGKVGFFRKDSQANRVYFIHDKAVTLCGDAGGGAAKMGQYLFGCITPDRIKQRQNGQRFNEGKKCYTLTAADRHGVLIEGYIRKLTPIECERLQTLPDNYTEGISNSQRYKCLGNGWTVDVIAHILSYLVLGDL
jgi:DNA (cytosine-5)-methyltransferase 3A